VDRPGLGGFLAGYRVLPISRSATWGCQGADAAQCRQAPHADFVKAFATTACSRASRRSPFLQYPRYAAACESTLDAKPGINCWPQPEVAANVNVEELGNSPERRGGVAIVAFLQTLNDGWDGAGK